MYSREREPLQVSRYLVLDYDAQLEDVLELREKASHGSPLFLGFVFASRGAVAGTVHDAEEGGPRADRIAILVRHDAGELMKVSQIVRGPSG